MSQVNNAIVTFGAMENEKAIVKALNNALETFQGHDGELFRDKCLGRFKTAYGGSKRLEVGILVAAFNGVSLPRMVRVLRSVAWEDPDTTKLFWCGDEHTTFRNIEWDRRFCPKCDQEYDTLTHCKCGASLFIAPIEVETADTSTVIETETETKAESDDAQ